MAIVAFVGVVVPLVATLIQWRSLNAEKEALEKSFAKEIHDAKNQIREELLSEMKAQIASEESVLSVKMDEKFKELDRRLEQAKAGSFHIQGNAHRSSSQYDLAVLDFCRATVGNIRGKDELNAQRTLALLIEECMPEIDKSSYDQLNIDEVIKDLIVFLEKNNENGRYGDSIQRIASENKAAKLREPGVEPK